jgi:chromosome segregation ATPase
MAAACATLGACAEAKVEPQIASSSSLPGYATRYPQELSAARESFGQDEASAEKLFGEFATYPDQISQPPSWQTVGDVYELADTDGRSNSYVERLEEDQSVVTFYSDEKAELKKKVGGAAQYMLKDKKECNVDVSGAAGAALDKAMEKQLQDRLHDRSAASAAIDHAEDSLGKKNADTLHTQADSIGLASYLTHVAVYKTKQRVERMVDEASDVKKTLGRTVDDLNKLLTDPKTSDAKKKDLTKELMEVQASQAAIDSELEQAKSVKQGAEERIKKLVADYDKAFGALKDNVKQREK